LALGKEPWRFKDLEDQLNMYRQQWQADQQKNIIAQMAGKIPNKSNDEKKGKNKKMIEIITIPMEDAISLAKAILAAENAEDVEEAVVDVVEEETIVSI
jgi:predicted helicase